MADIIARSFDPPKVWVDMGKPSEARASLGLDLFGFKDALLLLLRSPHAYNVDLTKALMAPWPLKTLI